MCPQSLCHPITSAGALDLEEVNPNSDIIRAEYGSPSGLPLLRHGDLKISQSGAIEKYLSGLVPKFAALNLAQQATDHMFCCLKEDVLAGCAKIIFGSITSAPTEVPKHCDMWFDVIEGLLPSDGSFVLGLEYPTLADLAVLNIAHGYMPFGAAYKYGKYDFAATHPKMAALAERTANAPGVKEYLASTPTMSLSFLDVDKEDE